MSKMSEWIHQLSSIIVHYCTTGALTVDAGVGTPGRSGTGTDTETQAGWAGMDAESRGGIILPPSTPLSTVEWLKADPLTLQPSCSAASESS